MKGKAGEPTTFGQLEIGDLFINHPEIGGDKLRRKVLSQEPNQYDGKPINYVSVFWDGQRGDSGRCTLPNSWPVIPLVEDER